LNCTIPALVKSKVGSWLGTREELGTSTCPRARKKSRNCRRVALEDGAVETGEVEGGDIGP
jgi:hypothetical protein